MLKDYVRFSDDLSDELVSAISELEVSKKSARNAVARHLKKVSIAGGDQATKEFLFAEARLMNEAISDFLNNIGMGTYIEQEALDEPLSDDEQKDAVEYNDGQVDELIVLSLLELMEAEGPADAVDVLSYKVIGRVGLLDVEPEVVEVVDDQRIAVRVRGRIPDSDFG